LKTPPDFLLIIKKPNLFIYYFILYRLGTIYINNEQEKRMKGAFLFLFVGNKLREKAIINKFYLIYNTSKLAFKNNYANTFI
jgi:hypothetical protein